MKFWGALLGIVLLAASPASSALVYYELTLTTDAPYTAFGGGEAEEVFIGTFGFDEILLGTTGPAWQDDLADNAFFLQLGINGTEFSATTPGAALDNALLFGGGSLLDVFFDISDPSGDRLEASTISGVESVWTATEAGGGTPPGGATFPTAVQFAQTTVPEPSIGALGTLGALVLLRRRRRKTNACP